MTSFAHTGSTFEKVVSNEMCGIWFCTSCSLISLTVTGLFTFKGIFNVIFVNWKLHKNGKRLVVFGDTDLKADVFLFRMAVVSSKSGKKWWFYGVLKKYWRLSVTSGPRDLCNKASAKCYNSTYQMITSHIIAIPLDVSKIFYLKITINYIGKGKTLVAIMTSLPVRSIRDLIILSSPPIM